MSFVPILILLLVHNISSQSPPNLTLSNLGPSWTFLPRSSSSHPTLYSKLGDDITLTCVAPYPIQWNFTGFLSPPEVVKIQPPRRHLLKNTFILTINIFFIDAEEFSDLGASFLISCHKIHQPELQSSTSLFVRGNNNQILLPPKVPTVLDSSIIPCATKDPTLIPLLYLNEKPLRDNNLFYQPTKGFISTNNLIFNGIYTCRLINPQSSVIITAIKSPNPNSTYLIAPQTRVIRVFADTSIQFQCLSKSTPQQPIYFNLDDTDNLTVSFSPTNYGKIANVYPNPHKNPPASIIKSNAVCWTGTQQNAKLIQKWSLEFIPTPTLYLDNFEGEVDCLSQLTPKFVQTVRCKNPSDCHFMTGQCLDNVTSCNFKKQKQFWAEKDTRCWIQKLDSGADCVSVPYSHLNGLAQCTVSGLVKQWEYFVSLDFLKYSDWRDAPENELVRMDEVPPILYTNGSTQFTCVAVAFLFADSLSFELVWRNGSRRILEDGDFGFGVNISNPEIENPRKIDEFNVIGVLDIKLPLEAVGINCLAPWWNGTEVMRTGRKFETRRLIKPRLKDEKRGQGQSIKQEVFYVGQTGKRLECNVEGEPMPVYDWYFNSQNVTVMFPELKLSFGKDGEGYLEFPRIGQKEKRYKGEWRCKARNRVGEVERRWKLDVMDEPISGRTWVYIVTVVVILMILAFVLAMLFIFMRRYKEAKELVRSLTDSEIDEFFKGKPELLENSQGNNIEIVDFLPYRNEYEIPMEDLEFDSSEKNVLGTGEFSYVVRGRILSKKKPVAVKICKPSADVTLFKSLLSEVKIMIYIGKHENVVALIGVCTQGIRNRNIHIATDICDLGSLDKYLRKCRPSFLSLINANQEIDCSLLPATHPNGEGPTPVNTLDLISFCGQIANGMEYLAYKQVVHADLAARNVLLTADKVCKISDFGLSKKLYESNNYVKKSKTPLPWRWMAIESLTTLSFSTSSDIWAYGVTLFEIFTLGDIPFPNEEWNKEFLNRLASGMRMGRPKYSTQAIYSKIVACWETEPELRPSFGCLRAYFQELLKNYPYDSPIDLKKSTNSPNQSLRKPTDTIYLENQNPLPIPTPTVHYAELDHTPQVQPKIPKPRRQYVNQPTDTDTDTDPNNEKTEENPDINEKPSYVNF